jgi:hypothetical protein
LKVYLRYGQGAEFDRNAYGVWPLPRPGELALTALVYDAASNEPAGLAPTESAIWQIDPAENHVDPVMLKADARDSAKAP